jgi:hypothetical protein
LARGNQGHKGKRGRGEGKRGRGEEGRGVKSTAIEGLEEGMEKRGEGGNKEGMYRGEVNTGKA